MAASTGDIWTATVVTVGGVGGGEADEDEGHCRDEDTAGGREVIWIGQAIARRRRGMG